MKKGFYWYVITRIHYQCPSEKEVLLKTFEENHQQICSLYAGTNNTMNTVDNMWLHLKLVPLAPSSTGGAVGGQVP